MDNSSPSDGQAAAVDEPAGTEVPLSARAGLLLIGAVFVVAICGLVYELIAGTLSSYLLGDSVTQFSLVIGLFLTAMGVGSYISKYFQSNLLAWLIGIEIGIGLIGGLTALIGFAVFAYTELYVPALATLVLTVGALVGLEIPLVIRVLRELSSLRVTLANVLTADYLGALAASIMFPFVLLPHLWVTRAGLLMGLANVAVAGLLVWQFRSLVRRQWRLLSGICGLSGAVLLVAFLTSPVLVPYLEDRLYADEIIFARTSQYQRIVITRWRGDTRLFLNGHLQFSTVDEYRYHEALVHPAMSLAERREHVLVLGGGDGLAARQILKYTDVKSIDIVDLDKQVTALFTDQPLLAAINHRSFHDPRVRVINQDAMKYLENTDRVYDVILMDLPDPSEPALGKLYSKAFYTLAARRLTAGGMMATQATSPFRARKAFSCIANTMAAAPAWGETREKTLQIYPYHAYIPTFGTWGFVLASKRAVDVNEIRLTIKTKFLSPTVAKALFDLPPDMSRVGTEISRLDHPVVVELYERGYHKYLD